MVQIPQQSTSSLSTHFKVHQNYVGDANQFVKGRRHVLNENRLCMQKARLNQVLIVKCNLPVL